MMVVLSVSDNVAIKTNNIKCIKVLMVEDNPDHVELSREMLREAKSALFDVEYVGRLSAGLKCLAKGKYDVVLVDLSLPDSSGLETFCRVRAQAPSVPVVVLSVLDDKKLAIEAVHAGAQDYLVKGHIDGQLLERSIFYAIERKQGEIERERALGRQQKLNHLLENLIVSIPLEQKLKAITDAVIDVFQADFCRIWMIKPGDLCDSGCMHADIPNDHQHQCRFRTFCLHLITSSGRYDHIDGKMHKRVPFGCYKIGLIAANESAKFLTNDVVHDSHIHNRDWARELGLVSFAGYRLLSPSRKPIGVLALFSKHPITSEEDTLLESLGNTSAQIIQVSNTEKALRQSEEKYRNLNKNLAKRVREEVERSRQKDFIMMHQSRLAAMGEMIGNIAHQWKQPLNALIFLLYNIKDYHDSDKLTEKRLDKLVEAADKLIRKMSATIDDFRNFFKPNKKKEVFNVNKIVKDTLSLVDASFRFNNISVTLNEEEEITVRGFANEYSQVILNIFNNAKDAIMARGVDGEIKIDISHKDELNVLKIRNNGGGIAEEIKNRVFDPYFTTKEEGEGAGIGLYMSKVIIEEHMNGHINVKNINGGVEFMITTPVS
jgi:signal transduction histidine kinase/CheY-like chemotaxis protein